jgi:hypothetical protein
MLEMRTTLKKIRPEENCFRYYAMHAFYKDGTYYVEFKWGRLQGPDMPQWTQKKALSFSSSNEALALVVQKLKEKEGRGYLVG